MPSVGLGVLLGEVTAEEVRADAERVPEKVVQNWATQTFGKTVQWLRRPFLRPDPAGENPVPNPG